MCWWKTPEEPLFLRVYTVKDNLEKFAKILYKNTTPMKWKYISSLKTRIYPKRCPNAPADTWSLVLQTRNLANKI
jgi:hypothetical protein